MFLNVPSLTSYSPNPKYRPTPWLCILYQIGITCTIVNKFALKADGLCLFFEPALWLRPTRDCLTCPENMASWLIWFCRNKVLVDCHNCTERVAFLLSIVLLFTLLSIFIASARVGNLYMVMYILILQINAWNNSDSVYYKCFVQNGCCKHRPTW